MKKLYTLKLWFLALVLGSAVLHAQFVITEYRNELPQNSIKYTTEFPADNYRKISHPHHGNIFVKNTSSAFPSRPGAVQISANLNLIYDAGQYFPLAVLMMDESGNIQYVDYEGDDTINIEVPEGIYDVIVH